MFERLCSVLEEFADIPKEEMNLESDILEDLGMNSIDMMEAVVAVEEEFSVTVADRQIPNFKKLKDIMDYLSK